MSGSGVAAIMVVRDERDVVGDSIGHLLALGVDRVLVADNGSTDGTAAQVRRIAALDTRVEWRLEDGPFEQAGITTRLAAEAAAAGAAWILPNDADEFLDPGPGEGDRIPAISSDPNHSWHLRRLVALDEAGIDLEWRANTTLLGLPAGHWTFDPRLRRIGRSLAGFRRALDTP